MRCRPRWILSSRTQLLDWLDVDEVQVYDVEGLLDLGDLWQIAGSGRPDLSWPKWNPVTAPGLVKAGDGDSKPDMFAMMRAGDVLVHFPYQSFTASVERYRPSGGRRSERAGDQDDRLPHLG